MRIGELNKRVTILKKQKTGYFEEDKFNKAFDVWSKIVNLHGKKFIEAQKVNPNISKEIIIRYIKELDTSINPNATIDYRIEYKGVQYNLLYSDNIKEENRFIELLLERI
nr:MAG: head-tail joining protein [Bacteriophage sp.]